MDTEIDHAFDAPSRWSSAVALGTLGSLTAAAALVAARTTMGSVDGWYAALEKPSFTPPSEVFAPAWSGLYVLMTVSAWQVWKAPKSRSRTIALGLWAAQLVANALWSPLFFGLRRPTAALVDLSVLFGLSASYAYFAGRVRPAAGYMMLPYLGWLGFAGALNEEIVRLN